MKRLFCRIGWHWMVSHEESFTDVVSGNIVYRAKCACGRKWLVDSKHPLGGLRMAWTDKPEHEDTIGPIPVHDACGLPVELCTCPDAPVVWDNELGVYVDRTKEDE